MIKNLIDIKIHACDFLDDVLILTMNFNPIQDGKV